MFKKRTPTLATQYVMDRGRRLGNLAAPKKIPKNGPGKGAVKPKTGTSAKKGGDDSAQYKVSGRTKLGELGNVAPK